MIVPSEFILDTDASDYAIGAVLSKVKDGKERVIAYGSRCLDKPERNYCVTRREMLAVVYFTKYFKHFPGHFTLLTDNPSLCFKPGHGIRVTMPVTRSMLNFQMKLT
jgi:hypothetical protein